MKGKWEKFKHRTLTKILIGYSVVAWVLIQVIQAVLPTFGAPLWIAQTIIFLLILGFPIATLIGWASESIPIKESNTDVSTNPGIPKHIERTQSKNLAWVVFASLIVVGLFGFYLMPFIFNDSGYVERSALSNSRPNEVAERSVLRAQIDIGSSRQKANGLKSEITLSPDGSTLVYRVARPGVRGMQYFARDLRSYSEPQTLQRSGMNAGVNAVENRSGFPSFKYDSNWIYYYTQRGSKLNRMRVDGGTPQVIQEGDLLLTSFAVKDNILFSGTQDGLIVKKTIGSEEEDVVYEAGEEGERAVWLEFIENTDYLMATILPGVFPVQEPRIVLINTSNGESRVIIDQGYQSKYAKSGHITYLRGEALWAVPFSISSMRLQGSAVPVINGIDTTASRDLYYGNYDFSEDGRLVYIPGVFMQRGSGNFNVLDIELTTLNHSGDASTVNIPKSSFAEITVSPDQSSVAMTRLDESGSRDVWVWDFERETFGRRSFGGADGTPLWSNDSQTLYYQTEQSAFAEIWSTASNGSSSASFITKTPFPRIDLEAISHSGSEIVYSENTPTGGLHIFELHNPDGDNIHKPLITPAGSRANLSRISPDGNWIAYLSNETGERHVYIQSFPDITLGKYQVTTGRGVRSLEWHPDGRRLFFTRQELDGDLESGGNTEIFEIDLEYGAIEENGRPEYLIAGRSKLLVTSDKSINGNQPNFDVLDEDQFIFTNDPDEVARFLESQVTVNVVENWFEELSRLVPTQNEQNGQ